MSGIDDLKNKAEGLAGKAKESLGNATDNESLKDEGKADQVIDKVAGDKGDKVKDALHSGLDKLSGQ